MLCWSGSLRRHIFKASLSWGVGDGVRFIYFKMVWEGGEEGVPLVYVAKNEKMNYNRKQAKEMKRKMKNVKTIQIDDKCALNQ